MHFQPRTLLAAALFMLAVSPALATSPCATPACGAGGGKAAPGPIAGAGLGFLVLAGGYYVVRRWRTRNTEE